MRFGLGDATRGLQLTHAYVLAGLMCRARMDQHLLSPLIIHEHTHKRKCIDTRVPEGPRAGFVDRLSASSTRPTIKLKGIILPNFIAFASHPRLCSYIYGKVAFIFSFCAYCSLQIALGDVLIPFGH